MRDPPEPHSGCHATVQNIYQCGPCDCCSLWWALPLLGETFQHIVTTASSPVVRGLATLHFDDRTLPFLKRPTKMTVTMLCDLVLVWCMQRCTRLLNRSDCHECSVRRGSLTLRDQQCLNPFNERRELLPHSPVGMQRRLSFAQNPGAYLS